MKKLVFARPQRFVWPLLALASLVLPSFAQAGTIVTVNTPSGAGLGFVSIPVISTPSEGNDNQPGGPGFDANIVVPIKRFDQTGIIDIEFNVRGSDPEGTTEYLFFESVDNNTGIDWSGYVMELGIGIGDNFVATGGDGLDFDAPDYDPAFASSAFSNIVFAEDILTFSSGVHSSGSEIYQIRIDVPDGIQTFTLRQYPIPVPEPGTMVLAAFALVGVAVAARRRR